MSRFLEHAKRILETAKRVSALDQASGDLIVLINHAGAVRIVQGSDWSLASLQELHGACMAYRVTRDAEGVRLTGIDGGRTIGVEAQSPAAKLLLNGFPRYMLK